MKIKDELKAMTGLAANLKGAAEQMRELIADGSNVEAIYHSLRTAEAHVGERVRALKQAAKTEADTEAKTKADAEARAQAEADAKAAEDAKAKAAKEASDKAAAEVLAKAKEAVSQLK